MISQTHLELLPVPEGTLFERIDFLIECGQRAVAQSVNAIQTLTFWRVGREIHQDILQEQRADYGERIVSTLSTQLSWSHIVELLPLASDKARQFYAGQVVQRHLGVRALRQAIARRSYERREIANSQIPEGSVFPQDTFTDPMILDLLGLHDDYLEKDLEAASLPERHDAGSEHRTHGAETR